MDLATLIKSGRSVRSAVSVLRSLPDSSWSKKELPELIDNLIGYLSSMPASARTSGPALEAIALAKSLATKLSNEQAQSAVNRLNNLDVRVIAIGTVVERMIYDKETIAVQAGKPVEFRFSNTDNMPHNFAIVKMGSLEEVGMLAENTARDDDAKDRHFVPKTDKVLVASRLLAPGESQSITFEVPEAPGVYPYVCTYPGHWRRMFGALYVVPNLDEYQANPEAYLAAHPLERKDELLKSVGRNTEWKYDDLIADLKEIPAGRSFDVGKNLFKIANCVGCHKMNGEGREFGPDLTKIDDKKHNPAYLLRSLIEPSHEINEKFQSTTFLLDSDAVVTGMVVEENDQAVKVLADPLAKVTQWFFKNRRLKNERNRQYPLCTRVTGQANSRGDLRFDGLCVLERGQEACRLRRAPPSSLKDRFCWSDEPTNLVVFIGRTRIPFGSDRLPRRP